MAEPTNAAPATPPVTPAPTAPVEPTAQKAPESKGSSTPVPVDEHGVAIPAPKKIWKLNVNGKEIEYDASDEAKLQRDIQKVFGIEEKARTVAQKVENADRLVELLSKDYKGFVKQCKASGIDADKLATDILYEKIRVNNMTPEQRELEEYKEREREAEEQRKAAEEAAKVAAQQQKTQEWAAKFEKDCEAALKANQIPKTRLALALVAQYIDSGLQKKENWTVEQVLPWVQRDLKEIHANTMEKLDGEELLNYIGESLSNKIAKARVDRYKKSQATAQTAPKQTSTPAAKKDDISHLKGKAYWAALRKQKSEAGIPMRFEQ